MQGQIKQRLFKPELRRAKANAIIELTTTVKNVAVKVTLVLFKNKSKLSVVIALMKLSMLKGWAKSEGAVQKPWFVV